MLKTLDNALDLLKHFTTQNPQWGLRELAKEMNINHTIVYRMLSTFEKHGFLIQNEDTKKYELGMKFLEYGTIIRQQFRFSDHVYPIMKSLSEQTGESIVLTWLDGLEGVVVEIAESSQQVKYAVSIGNRTPLYAGASNKVIMAHLPEEVQRSIIEKGLKPRTEHTITDVGKLASNLANIQRDGWAYSVGEYSDAIFGIAVPLFNQKQEVIASLTVSGPEHRMPSEKVAEVLQWLQNGRDDIQNILQKML